MNRAGNILFFALTAVVVFLSLLPFLWFFATSLKTNLEITAIPPVVIPSGPRWSGTISSTM